MGPGRTTVGLTGDQATEPYPVHHSLRRLKTGLIELLRFLAPVLALFLLWEWAVGAGLLNGRVLPPPSQIFAKAVDLSGPGPSPALSYLLWKHLAKSAIRAATGFAVGAGSGLMIGLLMGAFGPVYRFFLPILGLFAPIPTFAWTPAFLIALGRGDKTVIAVITMAAFIPTVYNTIEGPRSVTKNHIWAIQMMGAGQWRVFTNVLLPGSAPYLITGLRQAVGFSWRALVVAEMMGANSGIGYMIFASRQFMVVSQMFLGLVLLGLGGFLTENLVFGIIERYTVRRWGMVRS